MRFLLHFYFVGNGESRQDIAALGAFAAHEAHFQLFADFFSCTAFSDNHYYNDSELQFAKRKVSDTDSTSLTGHNSNDMIKLEQ